MENCKKLVLFKGRYFNFTKFSSHCKNCLGIPCDLDRHSYGDFGEIVCHESCSGSCNPWGSCDWAPCSDDVGFLEYILEEVNMQWCIDLDSMHMTGVSNGGMISYYVASTVTDGLGKYA